MSKNQICRHCKEPFAPQPGKNRFINECPSCRPEPADRLPASATQARSRTVGRPQHEQPEIKKQITNSMLRMKRFKGTSRKEAFAIWTKAYTEGKPGAKKLLDDVLQTQKDLRDL